MQFSHHQKKVGFTFESLCFIQGLFRKKKILYTYCESQCRRNFDLILTNPNVKTTKQQQQNKAKKHQSLLENRLATEKKKQFK